MSQQIIEERNKTHGFYEDNARVTQLLRRIVRSENAKRGAGNMLSDIEADALEMIVLKISRILTGARKAEHWEDIAGYARLAENFLLHGHTLGEAYARPAPMPTASVEYRVNEAKQTNQMEDALAAAVEESTKSGIPWNAGRP